VTPIIKRLELAEAALMKNGFVLVDDVWVAPAPVLFVRQIDLDDRRLRTPIVSKEGPTEDGWSVALYAVKP
jgi:hypothetical protein